MITHSIIIEIDEGRHNNYDSTCEITRLNELCEDTNFRPCVYLRFNPDSYKSDGKTIKGCFRYSEKTSKLSCNQKEFIPRFDHLVSRFEHYLDISNIPKKKITTIEYLFYSVNTE